jgi:hypothetical protein
MKDRYVQGILALFKRKLSKLAILVIIALLHYFALFIVEMQMN